MIPRTIGTIAKLAVTVWMAVSILSAQAPSNLDEQVFRIGGDVKTPVPVKKPEPTYSDEARAAYVQGEVMVELRIDKQGLPRDIQVLSPLGFGLDEQAVAAIEKWRFKPGTRNGEPVNVMATIQVTFRLAGMYYDKRAESRRSSYNVALTVIRRKDDQKVAKALQDLERLTKEKFAPARYLYGMLLREGDLLPQDEQRAAELIGLAAQDKYGPAIFAIAVDRLRAGIDPEKNREEIRHAAILGSTEAQYFIGSAYEAGSNGYARDLDRAMQFYRLCAASKMAAGQFRLGRLLLNRPNRRERDLLQGLAWLELAAEANIAGAKELAAPEGPLDEGQSAWVRKLKSQLVRAE